MEGLSLTSFLSELVAYTFTMAYNVNHAYAFSTWGDTFACWLQNILIVGLIFKYRRLPVLLAVAVSATLAAVCAWLFSGAAGPQVLAALQASAVVILCFGGRMPQILLNLRRGNSGELSMASTGLSVAGNLARVFTTATLVKDPVILLAASSQLVLNAILLTQCYLTARRSAAAPAPA